jgi:hypothetical protein
MTGRTVTAHYAARRERKEGWAGEPSLTRRGSVQPVAAILLPVVALRYRAFTGATRAGCAIDTAPMASSAATAATINEVL